MSIKIRRRVYTNRQMKLSVDAIIANSMSAIKNKLHTREKIRSKNKEKKFIS